jgi:hypothetical protein
MVLRAPETGRFASRIPGGRGQDSALTPTLGGSDVVRFVAWQRQRAIGSGWTTPSITHVASWASPSALMSSVAQSPS